MSGLNHSHLNHSRRRCELGKVSRFRVFRRRFRRLRQLSPVLEGAQGGGGLCLSFSSLLSICFCFTIHSQTTPFRGTNQPSYDNQPTNQPTYAGDEKLASYPEPHLAPPTPPPGAKMMMYLNQASYAARSLL
ncbi:unnamed protein product [Prunus armeniaca]|uniref:Uncharacterized protein n=1 Tax=Prunus armeniaca TaxID=36596 RepID=A0A6J5WIT3_PRUAR|nr:unnamed protein product [Prunus armeniaca]